MIEKVKRYLRRAAIAAVLLVFFVIPAGFYIVMRLGWPPVIGNLLAARSMTAYAAQIYPDWTPEGGWASYNLVDNGYDLSFTDGAQSHSLGYANGVVQDREREEALREELEIEKVLRVNGLWLPGRYTYWGVRWPAKTPDRPQITVDVVRQRGHARSRRGRHAGKDGGRGYAGLRGPGSGHPDSQVFRRILPPGDLGGTPRKRLEHHSGRVSGGEGPDPRGHFVRSAGGQIGNPVLCHLGLFEILIFCSDFSH